MANLPKLSRIRQAPGSPLRPGSHVYQLFQRVAADPRSLSPEIEKEINEAMFSEADWLVEQLARLRDDKCADAWRIWRLRELADYCRRSPLAIQQVKAFADFLSQRFSSQVQRAAAGCIRLLLPPEEEMPPRRADLALAWGEDSQRRFRDLIRLKAAGRISAVEKEELEKLAELRRKTVARMPNDEAKMHEQRLNSLRKVLGALDDYVRNFDITNSPGPGA